PLPLVVMKFGSLLVELLISINNISFLLIILIVIVLSLVSLAAATALSIKLNNKLLNLFSGILISFFTIKFVSKFISGFKLILKLIIESITLLPLKTTCLISFKFSFNLVKYFLASSESLFTSPFNTFK